VLIAGGSAAYFRTGHSLTQELKVGVKDPVPVSQEKSGVEGELCADCWRLGCLLQERALTHTGIKGRWVGPSSCFLGEGRCGG
jgi:hypothetical protein